ncbi:MAG TPA: GAF domain-containing sensor histidine kinase [Gemmatimonadaceae bacterium]|nr:GAF domain-containing sensor histidine kinase [Gemmatimonadaceae bacterium]
MKKRRTLAQVTGPFRAVYLPDVSAPVITQVSSIQQRLKRLEVASSVMITETSLEGVLARVAQVAAEVIGAQYAAIGLLGSDGKVLEHFTTYGIDAEQRTRIGALPQGRGILGLIIRDAKPLRLADLTKHPESGGFPPNHPPMRSFLGVPIFGRVGVFGSLYLTEKADGEEFTEEDEDLAILLAAKTSAAVENARHHQESARLLAEVQQLQRARERFFAMVNHELRNALAAVYGWSEILVRKRDPATVPRAAFEVLDSAQYAIGLINDLLDLSRLDEDRLKPVIRRVEPVSIARHAVGRVTPAANLKQVALQLIPSPALPNCETDASRVEQILVNLLSNAIKHAPEQSSVTLSITARDARVVYQVEDEGPGVPPTDVERIFDIYVTNPGEEAQGLGLGLPLSRRLARLLGGELQAVANPGKGGYFILEVPAAES